MNKIKKGYKNPDNESWESASKDKKLKDKYHIEQVPTIYINGKKVKNVYEYEDVKKQIEKER